MNTSHVPVLLWLDDLRPAPTGWTWVKSVNDAIALTVTGAVTHASLDHDLGTYTSDGGDGTHYTDWCAHTNTWPTHGIRVHSANPVGVHTMLATIDRYSPYLTRQHTTRGDTPTNGWPPTNTIH